MKLGWVFMILSSSIFAASEPSNSQPELTLDPDLLNEIYRNSVTDAKVDSTYASGFIRVAPQLSFINSADVRLKNNYFEVPYGNNLDGAPGISIAVTKPLLAHSGFELSVQGRFSYFNKGTTYVAQSKAGTAYSDYVTLHWLPVAASAELEYSPLPWLGVGASAGVGASYLYQMGNLDGLSQGFWVPFYLISPHLTVLRNSFGSGWFGGVRVGMTFLRGMGSDQLTDHQALEAGIEVLL